MNRKQLAAIMNNAWTLAREGAQKFGGNARQYFACALSMAWVEERQLQVARETPVSVWHQGSGNQFLLTGVPMPKSVKRGQFGLPGVGL